VNRRDVIGVSDRIPSTNTFEHTNAPLPNRSSSSVIFASWAADLACWALIISAWAAIAAATSTYGGGTRWHGISMEPHL
jgi:hypothetical protein